MQYQSLWNSHKSRGFAAKRDENDSCLDISKAISRCKVLHINDPLNHPSTQLPNAPPKNRHLPHILHSPSRPLLPTQHLSNSRQRQLTAALPRQNLRNSMSNRYSRLLNLLLGEASCDTDFQRWLEFPVFVFAAWGEGHAFEASY